MEVRLGRERVIRSAWLCRIGIGHFTMIYLLGIYSLFVLCEVVQQCGVSERIGKTRNRYLIGATQAKILVISCHVLTNSIACNKYILRRGTIFR